MRLFKLFIALLFPLSSMAADPAFDNIDGNDMKEITKGMGANFAHNSLMGASQMGRLFGFQVGVTAAQTSVPKIDDIAKQNAGAELPNLYNAGLVGAVGVPFGISAEIVLIPETSVGDLEVGSTSLAVKWNINEIVPILPVNVALRGFYSTAELSFDQTSPVTTTVKNETTVTGLQLLVSPILPIIEPYVGIGYVKAENDLTGTGIFDGSYTVSNSASADESGTQFLVGVEASLALFKLGAEYSRTLDNNRLGIKVALGF